MKRRYWALLALSSSPDGSLAPVQAQKAMFLLAQNACPKPSDGNFYHFEPYHYGPFDRDVYADLDSLIDDGLVRRVKSKRYSVTEFQITELGKSEVARVARMQSTIGTYLKSVVRWMRPLSFTQLVSAIYKQYPAFREKSIFRG
jgi:uncharacterized protein YwgA